MRGIQPPWFKIPNLSIYPKPKANSDLNQAEEILLDYEKTVAEKV